MKLRWELISSRQHWGYTTSQSSGNLVLASSMTAFSPARLALAPAKSRLQRDTSAFREHQSWLARAGMMGAHRVWLGAPKLPCTIPRIRGNCVLNYAFCLSMVMVSAGLCPATWRSAALALTARSTARDGRASIAASRQKGAVALPPEPVGFPQSPDWPLPRPWYVSVSVLLAALTIRRPDQFACRHPTPLSVPTSVAQGAIALYMHCQSARVRVKTKRQGGDDRKPA